MALQVEQASAGEKKLTFRSYFPQLTTKVFVHRNRAVALQTFCQEESPMRISRYVTVVAGFVFTLAVPSLFAQRGGGPEFFHGFGRGFDGAGHLAAQAKGPFTATLTEKSVQTLSNGSTITHQSTTRIALDSSGRVYEEIHRTVATRENSQPHEVVSYHVHDPVARTETSWSSETKSATVFHRPASGLAESRPVGQLRSTEDTTETLNGPRAQAPTDVQREDLGTKTVAGVPAQGTRITHVIPAGRQGNDAPITTTRESWRSTEYGIVLASTVSDPRFGTSERTVTSFQAGEPGAALFSAPEGYAVKDVTRPARASAVQ
jgi:hypothetical protein